jgi:hypothetical protein
MLQYATELLHRTLSVSVNLDILVIKMKGYGLHDQSLIPSRDFSVSLCSDWPCVPCLFVVYLTTFFSGSDYIVSNDGVIHKF